MIAIASMLAFTWACDDEDPVVFDAPTVAVNSSNGTQFGNGATAQSVSFNVSFDERVTATYTATKTGGITITNASTLSAANGVVTVNFDAGTTAGAASITLTLTDSEGADANATAVFEVLPPGDAPITFNSNGSIPSTSKLVIGSVLTVQGVNVEGADGVASVTATVNGAPNAGLTQTYAGTNASETYGFSLDTDDLGAGVYSIVFTATDANGSTATFAHALTIDPLGFSVVDISVGGQVVGKEVTGSINSDYTFNNDVYWVLGGRVKVTQGATLTIEAGTIVKGRTGTGSNATALLVARGSKLMAEGTAAAPIIFTAFADNLTPADIIAGNFGSPNLASDLNGQWGGVIILGKAPISASAAEVQIEGIPTSDADGLYGGTVADDNSGVLKYVSIRHGGSLIGSGNEINGLTLGGVGSGTVIDNIEVVANQDDGIEFFGGTVSVTNALIWNSFDDALDTDQAWNGTVDNFIIVNPNTGSAFELDGPEGQLTQGDHTFKNGTVHAGPNIADLIDFDASPVAQASNVKMEKIYFYGISNSTSVKEYAAMIAIAGNTSSVTDCEYTFNGAQVEATVFAGIPDAELTPVAANANTVGADVTKFTWTWASKSGALAAIGL